MTSTSMFPLLCPSSAIQQSFSYGEDDELHDDYELASFLDLDAFYPSEVISSLLTISSNTKGFEVPNPFQLKPDFSSSSAPPQIIDYSTSKYADATKLVDITRSEKMNTVNAWAVSFLPTTSSENQQGLSVPNPLERTVHPDPQLKPNFSSSSAAPLQTIDYSSATYADNKVGEDTTRSEIINEVCAEVVSYYYPATSSSNQGHSVPNPLATVHQDSQIKPDFLSSSSAPLVQTIDYSSATYADDNLLVDTTNEAKNAPICVSPSPSAASGKPARPPVPASKVEVVAQMPKSNRKKRCHSIASTGSSEEGDVEVELERRDRNCRHAKQSRLRKKAMIHQLQDSMNILKQENEKLRTHLHAIIGKNKTEARVVQECFATHTEKFVLALKKPENRVCDASTIAFLQLLQTKVKSIKK